MKRVYQYSSDDDGGTSTNHFSYQKVDFGINRNGGGLIHTIVFTQPPTWNHILVGIIRLVFLEYLHLILMILLVKGGS